MLAAASCDGFVVVSGKVTTKTGAGLADATVTLASPSGTSSFQTRANDKGCFRVGGATSPFGGRWRLRVAAEGFQPYETTVRAREYDATIVLERVGAGQASRAVKLEADAATVNCP